MQCHSRWALLLALIKQDGLSDETAHSDDYSKNLKVLFPPSVFMSHSARQATTNNQEVQPGYRFQVYRNRQIKRSSAAKEGFPPDKLA